MSEVFRIAVRNVLRHKRRAFITAITMTVGIAMFISFDSLMAGVDRMSIENMINLSHSSVKVLTREYLDNRDVYPLDHGISDPAAVSQKLRSDPLVAAVTRRTEFLGQLSDYQDSLPVRGIVVDPSTDSKVFALPEYVTGTFFGFGGNRTGDESASAGGANVPAGAGEQGSVPLDSIANPIVLGSGLASKFNLKVGDPILLAARTRYESQNADEFTVVGLLNTFDPAIDDNTVFIPYATANEFLDLENLVTELDVKLVHRLNLEQSVRDAQAVAASVKASDPALTAQTFKELGRAYFDLMGAKRSITLALVMIILLIAAVGIVNTVLMSVYARVREVGVLKALGFRPREVVLMFTLEGILVGVIGSVMGAILGLGADFYLITSGIPLSAFGDSSLASGLPFWGTMYGVWNPGTILFAVLFGILVATVAAIIPARKAAKMTATAALRFV